MKNSAFAEEPYFDGLIRRPKRIDFTHGAKMYVRPLTKIKQTILFDQPFVYHPREWYSNGLYCQWRGTSQFNYLKKEVIEDDV